MKLLKNSLIAPSLALLLVGSINAQELQSVTVVGNQDSYYDEYSSTSMKGEFRDIESPYSTNTTNKTLINDTQALSIKDTYDYTTGVTGLTGKADGIIIRGFELDLENVNVGGLPGLTSRYKSPTTSNIEKIEILKGPASVLYGSLQPGGYVNIQTKKPEGEDKVTFATSYKTFVSGISGAGDDNSATVSLDATGSLTDNVYYRIITVGEKLESFRDDVENDNFYIYPSLLWNMSDQSSLLVSLEYSHVKADADFGLVAIDNNINKIASIDTVYQEDDDFEKDEGKAIDIKFEHHFLNESVLKVGLRSVWHTDERELYENRVINDEDETLTRRHRHQYNEREWHTLDTNYAFKANTGDIVHNITAGATVAYRKNDYDRIAFGGSVDPISIYNPTHNEKEEALEGNRRKTTYTSKAIYLQDKADITDKLVLVGSLRADKTKIDFTCLDGSCVKDNTSTSNTTSGSAGIVYSLTDNTSIYASYAESTFPNSEQEFDNNGEVLDPEESNQIEVGIKVNVNEQFNTTLSFYKINKDKISEETDVDDVYEYAGEVESKGFEIDAQWLPTKNWQIKAGYAYNDAENISGDNAHTLVDGNPEHSAFIFTRYNHPSKILNGLVGVSAGLSYKDSVYTSSNVDDAVKLPSYKKLDIGIYYDQKDWSLGLNIENITNTKYFEYGLDDDQIHAGDPRNITINYKVTF